MSSIEIPAQLRADAQQLVYASIHALDEQRYDSFLDLLAPNFQYRIQAFSPEIRKQMTWLEHSKQSLAALLDILPKHHVNNAPWLRHATLYTLEDRGEGALEAVTSLAIFHTVVDIGDSHIRGGSSELFAVGRYVDKLRRHGDQWLIAERTVRLDTRQLGVGTHHIV